MSATAPRGGGRSSGSSSSYYHFAAGLGAGVFGAVLLQPIDLLKTRVQQSGSHSIASAVRDIAASPNVLSAFWRGTVPSALRTGFGSAIYFTSLNTIRQHAASSLPLATITTAAGAGAGAGASDGAARHSSSLPELSNTANLVAGATARAFAGFILMPLTVIKVRYESNLYTYRSIAGAARDIYRTERLAGFFAGFGATAARDAPYAGLYVLTYEQFKKRLSALCDDSRSNDGGSGEGVAGAGAGGMRSSLAATINFGSGALAGATCSFVSNPFDAVKTRIQLQPRRYRNTAHAARRMVVEEGIRSLYDGLALRMARKALSSALAWMLYEELVRRAESTFSSTGGRRTPTAAAPADRHV